MPQYVSVAQLSKLVEREQQAVKLQVDDILVTI